MRDDVAVLRRLLAGLAVGTAVAAAAIYGAHAQTQDDPLKPTLGDLMTLTQLRHYKLWYAQKVENWELAKYELGQFQNTISRIAKLYPITGSIAQANLIHEKSDPAIAEISKGIDTKNQAMFESGFLKLTDACNQCHKAAKVDFIAIQVPTHSPYANQNFTPLPK